jgi:penicillin-binding protein 1B
MVERKPRARKKNPAGKKSRRLQLLKILAVVISLVLVVVGIYLIRYYYIFDSLIRSKLGKHEGVIETAIYASPVYLAPGKRIAPQDLATRLRRLGYTEQRPGDRAREASYQFLKPNQLLLSNDAGLPYDAGRSALVTWSGKRVTSVVDGEKHQELDRFALRPELLSNAIDSSREKRRYVRYQDLPGVVVNAILASEDRRFFIHRGVDPLRIISALLVDVRAGDKVQGASTLTQQFVKNYFLTPERTWRRKIADAYVSILLEQRLSKEQIFELYCNEVYLGQIGSFGIVGVGEAAGAYFGKGVQDLTVGEAASIAGIISAPNRFSPIRYPERAKTRRDLVLDLMAEYDMITRADCAEAKAKPLEVKPSTMLNYSDAPYFVDYVQEVLGERVGDEALARGKYKVFTSLDMDLQQAAFEALRQGIAEMDAHFAQGKRVIPPGTVQASLIAVDPRNGDILAMVGGRHYGTTQFNRITQAKRQPGSIFKPFVYTAAIESAYSSASPLTAVSTVLDEPTEFAFEDLVYEPKNFKDEYQGQVTMRQAIMKSLNVATIKFAEKVGYDKIAGLSKRLGLNEQIKPYPAMAIGAFEVTPLEMVRAYTAFANGGLLSELTPILKVCDPGMKTVYAPTAKQIQAISPETAFMITSLMRSVIDSGSGAGVRARGFALPAAGKTGTSRDGWFAGYTPDMLCIVWVGFDDNRELNLSGSQSALPIWADFMKKAAAIVPFKGEDFIPPEGIVKVEIDPSTGLLATERCLERQEEYFIKGSEPTIRCYGNSYEQMLATDPANIYASPAKDSPEKVDKRETGTGEKKKPT